METKSKDSKEFRLTVLLNVLLLLQEFVNSTRSYCTEPLQDVFHDILTCEAPELEKEVKETISNTEMIENLLRIYKNLMGAISFDDWIESSEIVSEIVLQNEVGVEYWPTGSTGAPSNMQMLLAHHQALCCEALKVSLTYLSFCLHYDLFSGYQVSFRSRSYSNDAGYCSEV